MVDPHEVLDLHMRGMKEVRRLRKLAQEYQDQGDMEKAQEARDKAFEIAKVVQGLEDVGKGSKPWS